jgi:hypothetical protein
MNKKLKSMTDQSMAPGLWRVRGGGAVLHGALQLRGPVCPGFLLPKWPLDVAVAYFQKAK